MELFTEPPVSYFSYTSYASHSSRRFLLGGSVNQKENRKNRKKEKKRKRIIGLFSNEINLYCTSTIFVTTSHITIIDDSNRQRGNLPYRDETLIAMFSDTHPEQSIRRISSSIYSLCTIHSPSSTSTQVPHPSCEILHKAFSPCNLVNLTLRALPVVR